MAISIKSPKEIKALRKAGELTAQALALLEREVSTWGFTFRAG